MSFRLFQKRKGHIDVHENLPVTHLLRQLECPNQITPGTCQVIPFVADLPLPDEERRECGQPVKPGFAS
jgi:hypothetical protein